MSLWNAFNDWMYSLPIWGIVTIMASCAVILVLIGIRLGNTGVSFKVLVPALFQSLQSKVTKIAVSIWGGVKKTVHYIGGSLKPRIKSLKASAIGRTRSIWTKLSAWSRALVSELKTSSFYQSVSSNPWLPLQIAGAVLGVICAIMLNRSADFPGWFSALWSWVKNPNLNGDAMIYMIYIGIALAIGTVGYFAFKKLKGMSDDDRKKLQKKLALDAPAEFWDEHKKALIGTVIGVVFCNYFFANVEPFVSWHKSFRASGSNFYWINAAICMAVFMSVAFGKTGSKLSKLVTVLVAIALMFFTYNYVSWSKLFSSSNTPLKAQPAPSSPTTPKFTGNARDQAKFAGPERDSVMKYFVDDSTMADIAAAESHFTHFEDSTRTFRVCRGVLESKLNDNGTFDIGVMQINSIHLDEAKRLKMDICTLRGNMEYARHLYEVDRKAGRDGYTDWGASAPVWQNHYVEVPDSSVAVTKPETRVTHILTASDSTWSAWTEGGPCNPQFQEVNNLKFIIQVVDEGGEKFEVDGNGYVKIPRDVKYRVLALTKGETVHLMFECW